MTVYVDEAHAVEIRLPILEFDVAEIQIGALDGKEIGIVAEVGVRDEVEHTHDLGAGQTRVGDQIPNTTVQDRSFGEAQIVVHVAQCDAVAVVRRVQEEPLVAVDVTEKVEDTP